MLHVRGSKVRMASMDRNEQVRLKNGGCVWNTD